MNYGFDVGDVSFTEDISPEPEPIPTFKSDLHEFFWWMSERNRIFYRKEVLNSNPPWTEDEEMKNYHFCNVHRRLDRGTRFLLDKIIGQGSMQDELFNIILYRLLNLPQSYEAAGGFTSSKRFDPDDVVDRLHSFDGNVFSSAYRVNAHRFVDSDSKIDNVILGIVRDSVLERLEDDIAPGIDSASSPQDVVDTLNSIRAFGPFLTYEVYTDMTYTDWFPWDENDYVNTGPGAWKGINEVWDDPQNDSEWYIKWMKTTQDQRFDDYDIDFPFWEWKYEQYGGLTLRDIEHSLCEFSKYCRVKRGEGRVRRYHR